MNSIRFGNESIAICLPGQASQEVGMGHEAYRRSELAKQIFHIASEACEVDLTEYCWGSKTDELDGPIVQPALGAAILAELELKRQLGLKEDLIMGHSVSEIVALGASRAIELPDMFRLLKVRGILMDEANQQNPGVMSAFVGSTREQLAWMMAGVNRWYERHNFPHIKVYPGMHNSSLQTVASGHPEAMARLVRMSRRIQNLGKTAKAHFGFEVSKIRPVPVKNDGAAHTPYMEYGVEKMYEEVLRLNRRSPAVPVLFNDGKFRNDPYEYPRYLADALVSTADWHRSLWIAYESGVRNFIEVEGGNKQILTRFTTEEFPEHQILSLRFGEVVQVSFVDDSCKPVFDELTA